MASQKFQAILDQLKTKLSEKERNRMEGMTLKELMNDAEFKDLLKSQTEVLEGIETTLSDLSKLDKLDKLDQVISAVEGIKFPDPVREVSIKNLKEIRYPHTVIPNQFRVSNPEDFDFSSFELKKLNKALSELKLELPTKATDPISVRLSDGKEFYKIAQQMGEAIKVLGGGSSGEVFETSRRATIRPQTVNVGGKEYVAVVNPDGTSIGTGGGGGSGDASAAKQDEQTALLTTIDADTSSIAGAVSGTELQVDIVDSLPAGTNNIGIITAEATNITHTDAVSNSRYGFTSQSNKVFQATFPHYFNGTTWDRLRGDSTDGLLVNLGANNDVTATTNVEQTINSAIPAKALAMGMSDGTNTQAVRSASGDGVSPWLVLESVMGFYNGSSVDRAVGDTTNGLLVNLGSNNDITGTVTANLSAVDNAVLDQIELNQDSQTGFLSSVNDNIGSINSRIGSSTDAAVVTDADGSVSGKLRGIVKLLNRLLIAGDGVTTVTTAGTDVALASTTAARRVTIQAQTDNTGLIAVGATGVDATESTGTGVILYPGDSIDVDCSDLDEVFIDSTVNGEGVRYIYYT